MGMVANGENVLGFPWVGLTREIVIVCKTLPDNERWQLFFQAFEAFFLVAHPLSFPRTLHCINALAIVLSTSAREQPSSSLIRDSGLGDVV